jgi:hypothetical protein
LLFGALQPEDDIAIITGKLGSAPAINGNSIGSATTLTPTVVGGTASVSATGIVAQAGAADFFSFTAGAGTATVTGQVCSVYSSSSCYQLSHSINAINPAPGVPCGGMCLVQHELFNQHACAHTTK